MSVLAFFLALLLDQFRPLRSQHRIYAVMRAIAWRAQRHLDAGTPAQAWVLWALVVVVPALLSWLVFWLLHYALGAFVALVWLVLVLYASLDFRAFGLHFTEVRNAVNTGDEAGAADALARWHRAWAEPRGEDANGQPLVTGVVRLSLEHVHRYVFGVFAAFMLLAFMGLGPMGAVLFRAAEYASRHWWAYPQRRELPDRASPALARVAMQGWRVVNWLPAHLTALMYAAVGRYDEAVSAWRACAARSPGDGDVLVVATGAAAMGLPARAVEQVAAWPAELGQGDEDDWADDPPGMLHRLASMIWRTLVLWVLIWLVVGLIDAVI